MTDIVVVSLHAGQEYSLKPDESQISLSHAFIDAGADLVVGHHPHVIQADEIYKGKHIFYSLGNFVFDQDFSSATKEGLILKVVIQNKEIKEVLSQKIKNNDSFQPELSP